MEALKYILKRLFWSLGGGCVFNIFIIINYYVSIEKIELIDEMLFIRNIETITTSTFGWLFVISMVFVSIIFYGIYETGCQTYVHTCKYMYRKNNDTKEKNIYKKLKWWGKLYYFIFRETTTIETCAKIKKEEDAKEVAERDSNFAFMYDSESKTAVKGMQEWAKRIAKKEKNNEVYRFRDFSFLVQLMRFAFLIVSVISIAAMISAVIYYGIAFLFWWYLASFIFLTLLFLLTTPVAVSFNERYIRDVGRSYNALKAGEKKKAGGA
jgi:ABC-type multidrug transport system fused ATPase/permease subunit